MIDQDNLRHALQILETLEANIDKVPDSIVAFAAQCAKGDLRIALAHAEECMRLVLQEGSPDD